METKRARGSEPADPPRNVLQGTKTSPIASIVNVKVDSGNPQGPSLPESRVGITKNMA